jgi:hypothetical protein
VITVTFPIPKDQIKAEMDKIQAEITTRNVELRVLQSMSKLIRETCSHEFPKGSHIGNCVHCGHYVGSGD